jgi:TonB family protein
VVEPHGVDEGQAHQFTQGLVLTRVEVQLSLHCVRIVNVAGFGGDVEVAADDEVFRGAGVPPHRGGEGSKPLELLFEGRRVDGLAVGNVDADEADPLGRGHDGAGVLGGRISIEADVDVGEGEPRDDCDSIVRFLPDHRHFVPEALELLRGEVVVHDLGLLHTEDVRLGEADPLENGVVPGPDRVYVPRRNFHEIRLPSPLPLRAQAAAFSGGLNSQKRRDTRGPPMRPRSLARAVVASLVLLQAPLAMAQQGPGAVPRGSMGAERRAPEAPPPPAADDAPQIVMPELVHFEPAAYPEEAEAAGLEGAVILALDIGVDGAVVGAEVLEPIGHGFDEAARQAALGFRFEPATRGGEPIAVRIKYLYRFTLAPAAPETPDTETRGPPIGNLGGVIRLRGDDAPLVGARVTVTGPAGDSRTLAVSDAGEWVLEGIPEGRYVVRVEADGFDPMEITEEVRAGEATEATYRLEPLPEGLEIVVRGERPPREVTRRTIERREMSRIPGTSGDALRSIQSLPGVARPPGLAGLLIVRGSAPQDTEVFVDGASVPLIYHFGGLSSAVPTELLDRIDFYPGNFSARYGRVMGGVVDVALRSPNTECYEAYGRPLEDPKAECFHGLAQVDLIDTRALVQGPLGGNWSFAVGGRRSWLDAWLKPVLEEAGAGVTSAPVYHDYQLLVNGRFSDDSELSLRFYGSDDKLELVINDPGVQDPGLLGGNVQFSTAFYRAQAVHRVPLTPEVELTSMISVGRDAIQFGLAQLRFELEFNPVSIRNEFAVSLLDGFKLYVGQDILVGAYDVLVRAPAPPRPGEPAPGPFSTQPIFLSEDSGTLYRPAWFIEGDVRPSKRAQLVPGFRVDYARDSGHMDLSPRINGRYDLIGGPAEADLEDDRRRRTTLKGGAGIFHQPPQYQETNPIFGTPGIESNRSEHYTVGVEQELTEQIEVSLEGYYKHLDNLVARRPSLTGFSYDNVGEGYVVGAETRVKYNPDKRFFGWIAYTLSRSIRRDRPELDERLFEFDQTHNLTALGSYRLGRGWEFGARFRIISGPLATPVFAHPSLASLYAADAATYTPLQGPPFSQRLPLFHQMDVRIDKSWQFEYWRLSAFMDIQNVYNNPAVEALAYNYDFTSSSYTTGIPIIPSVGVRGEF